MAFTVAPVADGQNIAGNRRQVVVRLTFDSSYPTGGEAIAAADLGLSRIDALFIQPTSGYVFEYVASTGKIKAYLTGTSAAVLDEVANATNLSTVTATAFAIGV